MPKLTRRRMIQLATTASTLSLTTWSAKAQQASRSISSWEPDMTLTSGKNNITFKSQGYNLAGHLYTPEGFTEDGHYPAVVMSSAFNQVKEQTMAVYGPHLAALGYVAIAFDHVGFGDSEGDIRNYENPFTKMESIRDAISYMGTLPFVDRDNLFGLGICASGGYMALVATTDKRLKAIASVSGVMDSHGSLFDRMDRETVTAYLKTRNDGRQKAYETGQIDYVDALRMDLAVNAPAGSAFSEGYDYYMTERAGAVTYPNYSHLSPSFLQEMSMTSAMYFAHHLYTPYMGIYGERALADTAPMTVAFFEKATEPKELVEIAGASHVSLYDIPEDVDRAVSAMDGFFRKHGGTS